jgi:hypothetical protein
MGCKCLDDVHGFTYEADITIPHALPFYARCSTESFSQKGKRFLNQGSSINRVADARSGGDIDSDMMGKVLHSTSAPANDKQRAGKGIGRACVFISHLRLSPSLQGESQSVDVRTGSQRAFQPVAIPLAEYQITVG